MTQCPQCDSQNITIKNTAKRIGSNAGTLVGATDGMFAALNGARAGATIGEAVDVHLLENHACCECGHQF